MIKVLACAAVLSLISISANANTLTPVSSTIQISTNAGQVNGTTSLSSAGGTGTVVISPSVSVTSTIDDSSGGTAQGVTTFLDYYFEVIGGTPGDLVPVLVQTNLTTVESGVDSYAFAEIDVGPTSEETVCTGPDCSLSASAFNGTVADTVASGSEEKIHFEIIAEVNTSFTGGTATASADPTIYVDPTFANAANYCIIVSDGVGNSGSCGSSATPLPAALPLFATGLGALGLLARRRKRKAALGAIGGLAS